MQNEELKNAVAELSRQASLFCIATRTLSICISQIARHAHDDEETLWDLGEITRELTEATSLLTGDAVEIAKILQDKKSA